MRTKSLLLLLVALGCGVVASVAVSQAVLDQGSREVVRTVDLLIVAKDLSASTKISSESVRIEQWPAERVPIGALTDIKQIEGKFTKQRIYSGEPILEAKLSTKGKEVIVPEGFRVFDIEVKSGTGADGYIGPGDRVDVIGFFKKENRSGGSKTVTVMENVEVFMVDGVAHRDPETTTQKRAQTIQLLVKLSQLEVLNTATNVCQQLRLVLRPPVSDSDKDSSTDNGEKFLAWMKETEASEKPKSEPAPTVAPSTLSNSSRAPQHELLIVGPTKSTLYRWNEGALAPQKVDMDAEAQAALANANNPYAVQPSYPTTYKQPLTRPTTPPAGQATTTTSKRPTKGTAKDSNKDPNAKGSEETASRPPVDPDSIVQPNLTWDPNSGSWQSGGFNATYP